MRRSGHRRLMSHQGGFTLVEMLLVLAVVAIFASMALPSTMRMFGRQKLTAAAERVREAIALTRVFAIESGLNYLFCCEPNGVHYIVAPAEADHSMSHNGNQTTPVSVLNRRMGVLPPGVVFSAEVVGAAGLSPAGSQPQGVSAVALDGMPNASELAGKNWSTPIFFKPDGSAFADTEMTLSDSRSQQIRLKVRALTGAVSMEQLQVRKK